MKNIVNKELNEVRLQDVEKRLNDLHRYIIEDIVDDTLDMSRPWNYEESSIELFKKWIKIYNNMRIMRGMEKINGHYYYWHCRK